MEEKIIRRNDPCPCGSGKKYKKCYLLRNESCYIHLKEEHDKREKYVFNFLNKATDEITKSVLHEGNGRSGFNSPRVRIILCFVYIEVMANYWDQYMFGCRRKNKDSLVGWMKTFCFTSKNEIFQTETCFQNINENDLYDLRCSLMHAFSLPEKSKIIISSGSSNEFHKTAEENFIKKLSKKGKNCVLIKHKELFNLIFKGFEIMMGKFIKNIETKPELHIEGIKNIYSRLKKEGAGLVKLSKT